MFDAVAGAGAAVVARRPPAVLEARLHQRVLPVLPQEVGMEPGADVRPRQDLVAVAMAVHVPVDVEAVPCHGVGPPVQGEVLGPLLEGATVTPHVLDHGSEAAIAAR